MITGQLPDIQHLKGGRVYVDSQFKGIVQPHRESVIVATSLSRSVRLSVHISSVLEPESSGFKSSAGFLFFTYFYYFVYSQPMCGATYIHGGFPTSVNPLSESPQRQTQRSPFPRHDVFFTSIKLTLKITIRLILHRAARVLS